MQLDNSVKPSDDNSMSELKQILSEALMKKGIFGKIQAELRASIFSIFKEKELKLSFMSQIQKVNDIKSTVEGQLMFNLILEACDILGLSFSKSVLLSEASLLDVAVSQNALRHQLNLEGEGEKSTPVLLQLLKTLDVQDINLEEYVINEKHSQLDSFEAFKQKQLNININDTDSSSSQSEEAPVIMTSEMRTEKTIDNFKNRNNDILKKLDSIINIDKHSNDEISNGNGNKESDNYENRFEEDYEEGNFDDDDVEEVSLLDIQSNSLISTDEILKESKIIEEAEAEAAAKSLQNGSKSLYENRNDENNETLLNSLNDEETPNKYNIEEDSEIDFVTEISKDNDDTVNSFSENLDDDTFEKFGDYQISSDDIDDPSEVRKQATKSLIHDIQLQLENEKIENKNETISTDETEPEQQQQQISINDINVSKNIR
ncbi:hypothetical protein BCR36DRAFT_358163 [Piromyces finnis]|uniref:FGFR1 oncogene partner (FOP) N-terminal dimerisation domain-containing protein n=1 Tax=Piromyces finnis TaxID=1754191 RepID=A0A1Y1V3L1_9FUNG|nr:hypothetical protein BCR36DRAFT_358163 [Piromyces finnis]|eukprot:ORX45613.1 hypothetical protein BCR36DRAFT_358163 [Piromyces finnis]